MRARARRGVPRRPGIGGTEGRDDLGRAARFRQRDDRLTAAAGPGLVALCRRILITGFKMHLTESIVMCVHVKIRNHSQCICELQCKSSHTRECIGQLPYFLQAPRGARCELPPRSRQPRAESTVHLDQLRSHLLGPQQHHSRIVGAALVEDGQVCNACVSHI